MSPHVANGDKVGQHWSIPYICLKYARKLGMLADFTYLGLIQKLLAEVSPAIIAQNSTASTVTWPKLPEK
jgi:hypothetical protein